MSLMIREIRKSKKWKVTNEIPRNRKATVVGTHKNCQEKDVLKFENVNISRLLFITESTLFFSNLLPRIYFCNELLKVNCYW